MLIIEPTDEVVFLDQSFAVYDAEGRTVLKSSTTFFSSVMCRPGRENKVGMTLSGQFGQINPGDYTLVKPILQMSADFDLSETGQYLVLPLKIEHELDPLHIEANPLEKIVIFYEQELAEELPQGIVTWDGPKGCTVCYSNETDEDLYVYHYYALYRLMRGEWLPLPFLCEPADGLTGSPIKPGEQFSLDYSWSDLYGELEPGEYLLATKIFDRDMQYLGLCASRFVLETQYSGLWE